MVFVNSMSDLFHEGIPIQFIQSVFDVMNQCQHHTFQVLTKRAERLSEVFPLLDWTPNIWMGVTVENNKHLDRIKNLRKVPAAIRFLSLEPLLGPLDHLDLSEIDWVITGGESGNNARPIESEWVCEIRNKCVSANVPFFFKQWGGRNKKAAGKMLENRIWCERPLNSAHSL
jgi:protein gp37